MTKKNPKTGGVRGWLGKWTHGWMDGWMKRWEVHFSVLLIYRNPFQRNTILKQFFLSPFLVRSLDYDDGLSVAL